MREVRLSAIMASSSGIWIIIIGTKGKCPEARKNNYYAIRSFPYSFIYMAQFCVFILICHYFSDFIFS